MMERFDISAQDLKSFGFTTLFCIVIALATMSIWGGLFGEHLAISFSYGYSAFFSAQWIARRWPELSKRLVNILSLSCAVVLGTSSAYLWLRHYPGFDEFSAYKPIIFLGFIFSAVCFLYFLFSRTKNPSSRRIGSGSPPPVGARKSAVIESTQAATKSDGASFSIQYFGQY